MSKGWKEEETCRERRVNIKGLGEAKKGKGDR
jgi:hypothetical protein